MHWTRELFFCAYPPFVPIRLFMPIRLFVPIRLFMPVRLFVEAFCLIALLVGEVPQVEEGGP